MKTPPVAVLACAAFAAGLAASLLWPARSAPSTPRSRGPAANPSPLTGRGTAGAPPGATRMIRLAAGRARAAGMTAAECRDALLALRLPPARADREWWSALLTRWTEEEPAEALAWLEKESGRLSDSYHLVSPALAAAARRDLRRALLTARRWSMWDARDLYRAAAAVDPRAVAELALSIDPGGGGTGLAAAFSEWLHTDSASALEWLRARIASGDTAAARTVAADLRSIPPEELEKVLARLPAEERESILREKEEHGAREDPAAAMARLPELTGPARQGTIDGAVHGLARLGDAANLGRLLASLTGTDRERAAYQFGFATIPTEALRAFLALPELTFQERVRLFSRFSPLGGPEQLATAMEVLKPATDHERRNVTTILQEKWGDWLGKGGAENFAAFAREVREGGVGPEFPLRLMGDFCRFRNPEAARRLLETLPEDRRAAPLALHMAFQSLLDPAVDPAPALQDPALSAEDRDRILDSLFETDYLAGPERTAAELAFLRKLPPHIRAEALVKRLAEGSVGDAPVYEPVFQEMAAATGAEEWTSKLTECLHRVALQAAARDVDAGFASAAFAPNESIRREVEEAVFQQSVGDNPAATSEWLARQPEGERRDGFAAELAEEIQSSDPARAWHWAASITTDPYHRWELQNQILPFWRAADPEAASAAAAAMVEPVEEEDGDP